MRKAACARLLTLLVLLFCFPHFPAEAQQPSSQNDLIQAEAAGPVRFVAVHGWRSAILGYPVKGLEVWAYPFQVLSDYRLGFRPKGSTTEADSRLLLRRIDYQPDSVTRVYVGPDYVVRERLFVPLDEASAVIRYEVEGTQPPDILVHFQPVLNLMWPAALGGQSTRWVEGNPGFEIAEPAHGMSATVGSPEIVAHDYIGNSTINAGPNASFTLRPRAAATGPSTATVSIVLNAPGVKAPARPPAHWDEEEAKAAAHYADLRTKTLRLHTPSDEVNRAVSWAENALDQAWVCNPMLGCGLVAGYGPSRGARRPQYAWFFAGDGLIATDALVSAGEYARAKEELEFITKYQEPTTGMIWHELSQSAGYIDWSKYPYMYVHVDISFDYLAGVARYVDTSGDTAFATSHWSAIEKAYHYCRSLVRDTDHLPHIPADKEGGDEQGRPSDDLRLSFEWLAASAGFEQLARLTGHTALADEAGAQNLLVRQSIPLHYWDSTKKFWIVVW